MGACVGAFVGAFVGAAVVAGFLVVVCAFLVVVCGFLVVDCGFLAVACVFPAVVLRTYELPDEIPDEPDKVLPCVIDEADCEIAVVAAAAEAELCAFTLVTPAVLLRIYEYEPFEGTALSCGR